MGFATLQAVKAHFQHLEGLQFVAWEDNFVIQRVIFLKT
jgi:hypothetical protein